MNASATVSLFAIGSWLVGCVSPDGPAGASQAVAAAPASASHALGVATSTAATPQVVGVAAEERAHPCDGARFPYNVLAAPNPGAWGPLQCCQRGNETWHTNDGLRLVHRVYGLPCRESDGVGTNCGGSGPSRVECVYGPCGGRGDWVKDGTSVVFRSATEPEACGWQVQGAAGTESYPPGEGAEGRPVYSGVASTCPYTRCAPGGVPVTVTYTLTLTAIEDGATGAVTTMPDGISHRFAGETTAEFLERATIELTAEPMGGHARAVLSGGCASTGAYGESTSCRVVMNAARSVSVTYQCEPGFTCSRDVAHP